MSRVYVGKLPRDVSEREVRRLLSEFGRIREIRALNGFAFAEFEDSRDAKDAVRELDGTRYLGDRIIVEIAKERRDRDRGDRREPKARGEFAIRVENLAPRTSWQDLKDMMRKAGNVVFADVLPDGVGIVEFSVRKDMEEAIKLFDDYEVEGKRLIVKEQEKDGGGSRNGDDKSHARERSRSPDGRDRD